MTITLIAAVAQNGVIGIDNALPWRLPADMKFFKSETVGKPVLMGRKTFESLGKPLKDRTNIILSRTLGQAPEGCVLVRSAEEAVEKFGHDELMVIGGAEIYRQLIGRADRLVLTEVGASFEGDAYFPEFDRSEWVLVSRTEGIRDEKNVHPHAFCVYERKRE
ncbi:dihydrofolate reductase [Cohnella thailandensis]|uniref:Dihydrofolate reductase n=1 Tax=Cohnella thailandensis TaxID=557557 RepID=A0A841T698_9BACL|nr:dihydrofolate reductase [Cohnella thailandensis]MBB6638376.1 dihydrofolate reductase [Cohnella thailandensis]MBP1977146.1 dihydrofolate reductase [Cohnella thailandensis]